MEEEDVEVGIIEEIEVGDSISLRVDQEIGHRERPQELC